LGDIDVGYSACRSIKNGRLRVTGAGFDATDMISVRLDGATAAAVSGTSTERGEFDLRTTCPAGSHTLAVADTRDEFLTFAEFTC
jgi:hypothetical protein